MKKVFFDNCEVGQMIKPFTTAPLTRSQIAQFAIASNDISPLHLDEEFAKDSGFGSIFAPSIFANFVVEKALFDSGANMNIISLSGTFQRLIWPLDSLTAKGLLVRRYQQHQEYRLGFTVWCENQRGEMVMKGKAVGLVFKNEREEEAAGLSMPKPSKESQENLKNKCAHIYARQTTKKPEALKKTEPVA